MAPLPSNNFPLYEALHDWQPFRLDALGLITLLGADEVAKATGSLTGNVLTDYLPLLGAYKIASNQIAQVEPGFALYNITDGVWITEVQAWFTRWLWMNVDSNFVMLRWSHCSRPRQTHNHKLSLLFGAIINAGLIVFTTIQADWYGVANATAMFVSVLVRTYVQKMMLAKVDTSFTKGENTPDLRKTPSAKFIIVFPDGRLAIFCCQREYLRVMIDDRKPLGLVSHIMLRIARGYGWLAFAVQIIAVGQAYLSTQIVTVVLMVLASLMTIFHVGGRRQGEIGSYIRIEQRPMQETRRLDVYAKLVPSSEEESYMAKRGLLPDKKSSWGASWWLGWHEAKAKTSTNLNDDFRTFLNIPPSNADVKKSTEKAAQSQTESGQSGKDKSVG